LWDEVVISLHHLCLFLKLLSFLVILCCHLSNSCGL
jgi:hypothetical protein